MWIEVFRTGKHTSAEGVERDYTEADLDKMVGLYNEQKEHEAPLVLGHPESNHPAYGWIKELKRDGAKMLAYVEQVADKVVEAVRAGMFKKVSIAIYGNGMLRHVGLLGATVPAVKDLAPVQFKSDEKFDDFELSMKGTFRERFRQMVDDLFGPLVAASIIPEGDDNKTTHHQEAEMTPEEIKKQIDAAVSAASATFSETVKKVQDELKTEKDARAADQLKFQEELKKQKLESATTEFTSFCDELIKDGKVLPAERESLILEFKDAYLANSQLTFKDGEKSLIVRFKERLSARPKLIDPKKANFNREKKEVVDTSFAEFGEKLDGSSIDTDAAIQKIADERKISYEEAAVFYMAN